MKIAIAILATILVLAGCSKDIEYIMPKPYKFQKVEQPKKRTIRIHPDDLSLYEAYIGNFRDIIDFFNSQIIDYENSFNEDNTTGAIK